MRFALRTTIVSVVALLAFGATAAEGTTTRSVVVTDNVFTPSALTAVQADSVKWTNSGFSSHTTTSTITGAVGWNTTLPRGGSYTKIVNAAGTYAYRCTVHFGMTGSVRVPPQVSPASGPVGTTFTVRLAAVTAPLGYTYAPEVRVAGSASWTRLPTVTGRSVTYKATRAGSYAFRSSVRHGSLAGTEPSPTRTVRVG